MAGSRRPTLPWLDPTAGCWRRSAARPPRISRSACRRDRLAWYRLRRPRPARRSRPVRDPPPEIPSTVWRVPTRRPTRVACERRSSPRASCPGRRSSSTTPSPPIWAGTRSSVGRRAHLRRPASMPRASPPTDGRPGSPPSATSRATGVEEGTSGRRAWARRFGHATAAGHTTSSRPPRPGPLRALAPDRRHPPARRQAPLGRDRLRRAFTGRLRGRSGRRRRGPLDRRPAGRRTRQPWPRPSSGA